MLHPDPKNFFIGREFDLKKGKLNEEPVFYNPADMTTHAVVTGMTGSGKTGLCIGLLEEAALKGLPAIIIDPKGDLTNLILHFPELKPGDFELWIDQDSARLKGKSIGQAATEASESWKSSIEEWGLSKDSLSALKQFNFAIYSPGSAAGIPVNILSSFEAPAIPWEGNEEALRERISSTVTAILGLVGMTNIDPLKSREHILLSNIIEDSWSKGQGLTLTDLIIHVQKPPFDRLGAFPVDRFFPEKDRFELSMLLNNFLAAPSFQVWQQGQRLDIEELLYAKDGKPRHSIFYLSHLSDNERMFFVTLLFSSIESWMRKQRGTSGLRAIVYFDEILGYLPPVSNPPSRNVMLRMIKQARAFGVGLLLATQNPVDLDYKALSNIGTWFIGRLQTERDKMRLMDGLETLTGGMNSSAISDAISSLGKRVFLMNNVNRPSPRVFHARQVLNYLAGPLSREMLPKLNELAGASLASTASGAAGAKKDSPKATDAEGYLRTKPAAPSRTDEFFIPANQTISKAVAATGLSMQVPGEYEIAYKPAFTAQAEIRFNSAKLGVSHSSKETVLLEDETLGRPDWGECSSAWMDGTGLSRSPEQNATFAAIPGWLSDARLLKLKADDFEDWAYRNIRITVLANEKLKVYGSPGEDREDFLEKCRRQAAKLMDEQLDVLEDKYKKRIKTLEDKIRKQEGEVALREQKVTQHTMDAIGTAGSTIIGMLMGRKRSLGSSITKTRMTTEAKSMLTREKRELEDMKDDLVELEKEFDEKQDDLAKQVAETAEQVTETPYMLKKSDIFMNYYGIAWLPYYVFRDGNYVRQVKAFDRG